MPRRKELITVADGVLNSFISRNNDVDGYWGIGKLLNISLMNNQEPIKIDLLKMHMNPHYQEFDYMIKHFSNLLIKISSSRKIPLDWMKSASIEITSFLNEPQIHLGQMAPHRLHCKLLIVDDFGHSRLASKDVWCRQHYPENEMKSGRSYKRSTEVDPFSHMRLFRYFIGGRADRAGSIIFSSLAGG